MREITGPAAQQGSEAWLELRKGKRTASVCFTMCKGTPSEKRRLALQLQGKESVYVNSAMARGTEYEPEARASAEVYLGVFLEPKVYELGVYLASLDGISECGKMVEIKVPASVDSLLWASALDGVIPERYVYQMTMQYMVASPSEAFLYVYLPEEKKGICLPFQFSPLLAEEIRQGCDAFWTEYMGDTMPDDPERTDQEWLDAVEAYRNAHVSLEQAKSIIESRKDVLITLANKESAKGAGLRLTKVEKEGAIKYADYCKKAGIPAEALEPYRGKGSVSFSVTLGK